MTPLLGSRWIFVGDADLIVVFFVFVAGDEGRQRRGQMHVPSRLSGLRQPSLKLKSKGCISER